MAVRITSGTTNRTYLKNLNGSQKAMNRAMERVETGRDFQRVSDNVTKATRAISVRERLYRNEQMTDNVNTAMEQLNMAESALKQMNDICSNVQSEMFKALNTPTLQAGKDSFSAFLDGAKDEIMRLANTKYNDKYVLGGVGVEIAPFKSDENGNMVYNPQSGDSKDNINLSDMVDRNQMINSIAPYETNSSSGTTQRYVCIGGVPAQQMNFSQLKDYLGETDDNVFTTKYLSGSNIDDWKQGTFWVPATCTHKEDGFLGLKPDGSTFVDYSVTGTSVMRQATITDKPPVSSTQIKANVENYYYDGAAVKYSGDSFMDIGLDMSVTGNGKVAPKTAFRTTVDGIAAMGYGTSTVSYEDIKGLQASAGYQGSGSGSNDSETVCNNIYDMMNEMQKAIDSLDEGADISNVIDKISAVMVNFKKQTDNIIAAESEIGVRTQFLETNLDRLEAENTSLKKMQKDIETVDDATEITNFLGYQNAWNLVLQFGKNIVPKSLMDYVN